MHAHASRYITTDKASPTDVAYKSVFFMLVGLITAFIWWIANIAPVLYHLLVHPEFNTEIFVRRAKTHYFLQGDTLFASNHE